MKTPKSKKISERSVGNVDPKKKTPELVFEIRLKGLIASPRKDENETSWLLTEKGNPTLPHHNPTILIGDKEYQPAISKGLKNSVTLPTDVGKESSPTEIFLLIKEVLKETIFFPDEDNYDFVALYILATWNFDLHESISYLTFVGQAGHGKSEVLKILQAVCLNGIRTSGSDTDAVLLRIVDQITGTLCMDEAQQDTSNPHNNFHKMLALGNSKGGVINKCEKTGPKGDTFDTKSFNVFCPKIFSARYFPSDPAITRRTYEISMRPMPKDFKRTKTDSDEFKKRLADIRNSSLVYRHKRFLNDICPHGHQFIEDFYRLDLTHSDLQTFLWLVTECPNQDCYESLKRSIISYRKNLSKRNEFSFSAMVVLCLESLFKEKYFDATIHISEIRDRFDEWGTKKPDCRTISSELRSLGFELSRDAKGFRVFASREQIEKVKIQLGIGDNTSQGATLATRSTSEVDDE